MKKLLFFLLFLASISIQSQEKKSLNNYKYVVVPSQFDFLKKADEYQLNSLTKFLFKKNGFTVFFSDEELPTELAENPCLGLKAKVNDDSSMFSTKNIIELSDCYNTVIFTSDVGKSKIKDYKKAYQDALRKAFKSVEKLNYSYQPSNQVVSKPLPVVVKTAVVKPVVKQVAAKKAQVIPEVKKEIIPQVKKEVVAEVVADNTLYAQPKQNGFQLVNSKPEVVFQLLKTNMKDVYLLKDKKGVFYKSNGVWLAEFYQNNQLMQQEYNVKF